MARTHKATVISDLNGLQAELKAQQQRVAEALAKAEETTKAVERQLAFCQDSANVSASQLENAEQLAKQWKGVMPDSLYQQIFAGWDQVTSFAETLAKQTQESLVAKRIEATNNPHVQWIWRVREVEANAKAEAERIERERIEAEQKALAEQIAKAQAEAKAKADAEAEEIRQAQIAHEKAIQTAIREMDAHNTNAIKEAQKSGLYAEWQKDALAFRGEAVRQAHHELKGKPSREDVRRYFVQHLPENIELGSLILAKNVDGTRVVSPRAQKLLVDLVDWAERQPKPVKGEQPASVQPVVAQAASTLLPPTRPTTPRIEGETQLQWSQRKNAEKKLWQGLTLEQQIAVRKTYDETGVVKYS